MDKRYKLNEAQVQNEIKDILNDEKWGDRDFIFMKDGVLSGFTLLREDRRKSPIELYHIEDGRVIQHKDLEALVRAGWIVD